MIFQERRKTSRLDLEAIEMAVRSAMHHAGATALSELLQFPVAPMNSGLLHASAVTKPAIRNCAPSRC